MLVNLFGSWAAATKFNLDRPLDDHETCLAGPARCREYNPNSGLATKRPCLSTAAAFRIVLRQRLDNEVEPEPQTPTVMIKKHRKNQCHHEEQYQHTAVLRPNNQ